MIEDYIFDFDLELEAGTIVGLICSQCQRYAIRKARWFDDEGKPMGAFLYCDNCKEIVDAAIEIVAGEDDMH